jgi:hypothetical protein
LLTESLTRSCRLCAQTPESENRGCARHRSPAEAQPRSAEQETARHVPAPYVLRPRKPRLGQWAQSHSTPRRTCPPGRMAYAAVPSGAWEEHAVLAAPLVPAREWEQRWPGPATQLPQERLPRLVARGSSWGFFLPASTKQLPKRSSNHFGSQQALPRESLVRARGGLVHHQFERLSRSVWSCRIILPSSGLFCRFSSLWEFDCVVIHIGWQPWAQCALLATPVTAKRGWR